LRKASTNSQNGTKKTAAAAAAAERKNNHKCSTIRNERRTELFIILAFNVKARNWRVSSFYHQSFRIASNLFRFLLLFLSALYCSSMFFWRARSEAMEISK